MARRGSTRSSAQNHLAGHELALVLAEGTGKRLVSWITGVGAGCPFPAIAEKLLDTRASWCCGVKSSGLEQVSPHRRLARKKFPFRFRGEPVTLPTCERIRLEKTDVAHGLVQQRGKPVPTPEREH